MIILALEFSADQRSVACSRDDAVLAEVSEAGGRATNAVGMMDRTLKEAGVSMEEVDNVVIGTGPGSYTGIRTAIAVAEGWHLVRPIRFLGLSSVECMAAQAQAVGMAGRIHVVVDAQRGDVYHSIWSVSDSALNELSPLRIVPTRDLQSTVGPDDILIGPEAIRWHGNGRTIFPSAGTLCRLGAERSGFFTSTLPEPIYLREANFVKAPPSRSY